MQRRIAIATTFLVATSLAVVGCSSPAPGGDDNSGEIGGTLTIAAASSAKPDLDPIIEKFKAEYPEVEVKASYADNQQYQATIRTQLSAGTAPDIFYVWPGNGNPGAMEVLTPAGYLKDLSTISSLPELPDALTSVTQIDGKQYVFPMTVAGIGAIYNEQAVASAKATVPTTWSEVLDFCADAQKAGKVAFSLGLQTLWVTQLINYALVPTLVYSPEPDFEAQVADGKATFEGSGWNDAFTKYMKMESSGCFNPDPLGTSVDVGNDLLAKGKALATVTLTTSVAAIKALAPAGTTFGMFALPATNNADDTWMPAAAFDGFGMNAKAKNPAAAEKFFQFMTTSESVASYATIAGSLPSITTDDFVVDSSLEVLNDYWQKGSTYPFPDQLWPNPMVSSTHKEGVQKVFGDQATITDILKAMDVAYKTK